MHGIENADSLELLLLFVSLVVAPLLALVVLPTGIGGAIYWAVKRSLPRSRFVKTCMILLPVLVFIVVGLWMTRGLW